MGRRVWVLYGLRVGFSLALLGLLVFLLPLDRLAQSVQRLSPAVWLLVLLGFLATHACCALKWYLLIGACGGAVPIRLAFQAYFAGLFGNLLLPSIIGGDMVAIATAYRRSRQRAGLLLGSALNRAQDLVALLALATGSIFLLPSEGGLSRTILFGAAGSIVGGLLLVCGCAWLIPARICPHKARRKLVRVRRALLAIRQHAHVVALTLGFSLALQASLALLNFGLARSIGLNVGLAAWVFAWPLAKLAAFVPLTQGGIGAREVALVALLAPLGADSTQTFAVGLCWESIVVAAGLLGGLLALRLAPRSRMPREVAPLPTHG